MECIDLRLVSVSYFKKQLHIELSISTDKIPPLPPDTANLIVLTATKGHLMFKNLNLHIPAWLQNRRPPKQDTKKNIVLNIGTLKQEAPISGTL